MERDEALKLLRGDWDGIAEWNRHRRRSEDEAIPDLGGADLVAAYLGGADLRGIHLVRADLREAALGGAHLEGAVLHWANLGGADLRGADLRGADLVRADLGGADLTEARCAGITFADVDLSKVKGLEAVRHEGPSTIGTDTLFRSKGRIPEVFLRGCGMPNVLIEYLPSLIGSMAPIQFYSCFISYSARDTAFAQRLHADLQSKGVRCWFAPEDLKIGARIRVGIDESIRVHDKLLLILSKHSTASDWVEKEVEAAMEQERKRKQTVLFPIRLDDAVMKVESGWPADVRRGRNIGDFKRWKDHDAYQKSFARLIRDLKAAGVDHAPAIRGVAGRSGRGRSSWRRPCWTPRRIPLRPWPSCTCAGGGSRGT